MASQPHITLDTAEVARRKVGSMLRSTVALLSLVTPRVVQGTSKANQKVTADLDRLSLLFVSEPKEEVVALSAFITSESLEVIVAYDGRAILGLNPLQLNVAYNERRFSVAPGIRAFLQAQPRSREDHVKIINGIICRSELGHQDQALYIVLFSFPKIYARFTAKIPGAVKSFIELFLDSRITTIRNGASNDPVPFHLKTKNDDWVNEFVREEVSAIHLFSDGKNVDELNLWAWLYTSLRNFRFHGQNLLSLRRVANPDQQQQKDLDELGNWMVDFFIRLSELLTQSPKFWTLLRNSAFKTFEQAVKDYPTKAAQEEASATDYEVADDLCSEARTQADLARTNSIREWLKLCAAWGRIICELRRDRGRLAKLFATRSVSFRLVTEQYNTPELYPMLPVEDVITEALGPAGVTSKNIDTAKATILEGAKARSPAHHRRVQELLKDLSKVNDKIHCECQLASHKVPGESLTIGVSKRCCYLCDMYLGEQQVEHSASHGKVYPWKPPADASQETLERMLQNVQYQLLHFMGNGRPGKPSGDSAASDTSQESQAPPKHARTPLPEDVLTALPS